MATVQSIMSCLKNQFIYKKNHRNIRSNKRMTIECKICNHTVSQRILVFPAASSPNMRIRISLLPKIFDNNLPILPTVFYASGTCTSQNARYYISARLESQSVKRII